MKLPKAISVLITLLALPVLVFAVYFLIQGQPVVAIICGVYLLGVSGFTIWLKKASHSHMKLDSDRPFTLLEIIGYAGTGLLYVAAFVATAITQDWFWSVLAIGVASASLVVLAVQTKKGKPLSLKRFIDALF